METKEQRLRQLLEDRPSNARAMADLACVLAEQASQSKGHNVDCEAIAPSAPDTKHMDANKKSCIAEAIQLAHKSVQTSPHKPYGYTALSMIHPDFDRRMDALRKAISCTTTTETGKSPPHQFLVAKVGLLIRLLTEPREEEGRRQRENTGACSRQMSRRDLDACEEAIYKQVRDSLERAWEGQEERQLIGTSPSLHQHQANAEFLGLREYKLGMFFRKLEPSEKHIPRSRHHLQQAARHLPHGHTNKTLAQFWLATISQAEPDGIDNDKHHEAAVLDRCPREYVVALYSTFADYFDELLVGKLGYQTPALLRQLLDEAATKLSLCCDGRWIEKAVDLGCGTGLSGMAFRDCVEELIGVDLSPEMVEKSSVRACYDQLLVGDVTTILVEESNRLSSLSLVYACDVFVYLGDLSQVFTTVFHSLRPHGIFAFSTELLDETTADLQGSRPNWFVLQKSGRFAHKRSYLEGLASSTGFELAVSKTCPIRKNQGRDVIGLLMVLIKGQLN